MSKEAKILLLIAALFTLAIGISNIFVNIFLWKNSNDFILICKYNLMHYIFTPLMFIVGGYISKRKNGIWSLRIGIFFFIVFFVFILWFKDNVISYVYPLGILFGIASGFYWLSYNVLSYDFTSTNNRDTFNGFNGFVCGIAAAIAPFSASYIIENYKGLGYTIVFGISLALFIILILVSLILKSKNFDKNLDFRKVFGRNSSEWGYIQKSFIAYGFRDVIIFFVVTILIYTTTKSEITLGRLTLLTSLISSAAYYIEQRIIKPKRRMISLYIGAVFMFLSTIGIVVNISFITLLIFMIVNPMFFPFFYIPMNSASFNILDKEHEECMRIEYIINKDIALNIGRIISTFILIGLLTFVKNSRALNYFLLFISCSQFISIYFLRKLSVLNTKID
ncbi:MFS transporter [Alkalithermobacter paradoxus]|uniref:Major facilitator superfamily protein n=1 Tax=Alkalithermobacter paradoxus TaxID=29349 RepID=A0A1V4IAT6_9FIRM|nr:major facilitator superfamily protein [[Clostridium] thermoalcaliphilum]